MVPILRMSFRRPQVKTIEPRPRRFSIANTRHAIFARSHRIGRALRSMAWTGGAPWKDPSDSGGPPSTGKNVDINSIVEEYGLSLDIQPLQGNSAATVR